MTNTWQDIGTADSLFVLVPFSATLRLDPPAGALDMRRILPFPTRRIPIAKVWSDDEVKPAYRPPASAVADFKRVCDEMGVETREEPCLRT